MDQSAIIALLGDRPVAYHPILAKSFSCPVSAIFLSQLLYWQGKGKYGEWTYKTQAEMYEETGLSRRNQETARRRLGDLGILEEQRRGVPAKMWYRVDLDKLCDVLQSSMAETYNPDCTNRTNWNGGTVQTITETTTQTTPETTKDRREKSAPTSKQTADPRGKAPAIQAARQVVGRYPPKELWDSVMETLGESPDMEKLTECRKEWVARGYNGNGWAWLLDWYKTGVPKRTGGVVASNKAKDVMAEWLAEQEEGESGGDRGATERGIRPVARKGNKGFTELVAGLAF